MEWNKNDVKDFIELYHQKNLIWNPQHSDHFNKIKKQDAWADIASKIGRPVEQCKKEMENLLSSLRREKMKIKKSVGTGKGKCVDIYTVNSLYKFHKNKKKNRVDTIDYFFEY
jgi:hypothetical protein